MSPTESIRPPLWPMLMQPFVSILTLPSARLLLIFLEQGLAGLSLSFSPSLSLSLSPSSLPLWWEVTGAETVRIDRRRHGEDGRAVMWAYYSRSSCTGSAVNPQFPCTSSCPPFIPLWRSPSTSRLSLPPLPLAPSLHPRVPHRGGELWRACCCLLLSASTSAVSAVNRVHSRGMRYYTSHKTD